MSSSPGAQLPPVQGVNVMLGGAMLSGIILIIFVICYCCHKNARKWESNLPSHALQDWSLPLQIYTIQPTQYTVSDLQAGNVAAGPPPAYEAVVEPSATKNASTQHTSLVTHHQLDEFVPIIRDRISDDDGLLQQQSAIDDYWVEDDSGLPSYDAALRQKMIATQDAQMHI